MFKFFPNVITISDHEEEDNETSEKSYTIPKIMSRISTVDSSEEIGRFLNMLQLMTCVF